MKKRILTFILLLLICNILCAGADNSNNNSGAIYNAIRGIQVTVDDKQITFPDAIPYVDENSRTLIPLRAVADAIQCETTWDNFSKSATVKKTITVDEKSATLLLTFYPYDSDRSSQMSAAAAVDGHLLDFGLYSLDTKAVVQNERIYLPIRCVAEYFGYTVQWDNNVGIVRINSDGTIGSGVNDFSIDSNNVTVSKLCSSVWVSNGISFSSISVFEFKTDGSVIVTMPSGAGPWNYKYILQDGTVSIIDERSDPQVLHYDANQNILVDNDFEYIVERDRGDGFGNYIPAKMATQILQPYDCNPFENENAILKTIIPKEFTETHIKQTMRPYLQALSDLNVPLYDYCKSNKNDTFPGEPGYTFERVTNFSTLEEVKDGLRPYFTNEYLEKVFPYEFFKTVNGALYIIDDIGRGSFAWDANSVSFVKLISNNEVAIAADRYIGADLYLDTGWIYLLKENGHYVVSGIAENFVDKHPGEEYRLPPGYDPI